MISVSKFWPFIPGKSFPGHLFNPKHFSKAGRKEAISRGRVLRKRDSIPPVLIDYPGSLPANPSCPFASWEKHFIVLTGEGHVLKIIGSAWLNCWEIICTLELCDVPRFHVLALGHSLFEIMEAGCEQMPGPSGVADWIEKQNQRQMWKKRPSWGKGGYHFLKLVSASPQQCISSFIYCGYNHLAWSKCWWNACWMSEYMLKWRAC